MEHQFTHSNNKIGIREFRADLALYLNQTEPLAVTRHGQTVGYFIPTPNQSKADTAALLQAGESLDRLLAKHQVSEDDLISDFKQIRQRARRAKVTA
jgi:antitoxin (DNA-binding transcriptional repressor) of toxin-antitoxin stability system